MIKKWDTVGRSGRTDLRIFSAEWIDRRHPEWGREGRFVVLDSPEWVNIIPVTRSGNILLIKQYRHGTDNITIEVPGGLVEPGEDPRLAAERECAEETGFCGEGPAVLLGINRPNPAFMNNSCSSFLWTDCKKQGAQKLDRHEDIEVIEATPEEVKEMIADGRINHSLVLVAFYFYTLKYGF